MKVLWLEDEFDQPKLQGTIVKAQKNGFIIDNCKTAQEFLDKIDKKEWDAIILDVIGKRNTESELGQDGFDLVFDKVLADYKDEPWFVFSGQTEITKKDSNIRGRLLARHSMRSFAKVLYVKGENNDELFEDIKSAVEDKPKWKIRQRYSSVFEACTEKYIGDSVINELTDILLDIHGHKEINPKVYFTQLRIILEYVFRAANKIGLLHDVCIDGNGKVNLTESSHFLAGELANLLHVKCLKAHFPKILADNIKNLLFVTGGASHTTVVEDKDIINFQSYTNDVKTPYLLYSLTYIICDVLIWYKQYADTNSDVSINKSLWIFLPKVGDKLEIKTDADGNFHCGDFCLVDKIQGASLIGADVTIIRLNNNTDKKTNAKYPYFAAFTL